MKLIQRSEMKIGYYNCKRHVYRIIYTGAIRQNFASNNIQNMRTLLCTIRLVNYKKL